MLKQAFVTLIALSGLNEAATAQTATPPAAAAQADTCALPSVADSVDLQDVLGTDLRTVPVAINGTSRQFLLDIGTNLTEVSQATVTQLALPDVRNSPSDTANWYPGVDTNKEKTSYANFDMNITTQSSFFNVKGSSSDQNVRPHVRIASFIMGGGTGKNLTFVIAKDQEMGKAKAKPYDGLMTGGFFKQYDVELDFAGNKLAYLTPTACTDAHRIAYWSHAEVAVIPMTIEDDGKMHVQVSIQGHVINAAIDTSSDHSIMRRGVAEQTLGFKAGKDMSPDGDRQDGMGQQIYILTFPQISFAGGVTAINVPARIQNYSLVHDLHREPVLGSRCAIFRHPGHPRSHPGHGRAAAVASLHRGQPEEYLRHFGELSRAPKSRRSGDRLAEIAHGLARAGQDGLAHRLETQAGVERFRAGIGRIDIDLAGDVGVAPLQRAGEQRLIQKLRPAPALTFGRHHQAVDIDEAVEALLEPAEIVIVVRGVLVEGDQQRLLADGPRHEGMPHQMARLAGIEQGQFRGEAVVQRQQRLRQAGLGGKISENGIGQGGSSTGKKGYLTVSWQYPDSRQSQCDRRVDAS